MQNHILQLLQQQLLSISLVAELITSKPRSLHTVENKTSCFTTVNMTPVAGVKFEISKFFSLSLSLCYVICVRGLVGCHILLILFTNQKDASQNAH